MKRRLLLHKISLFLISVLVLTGISSAQIQTLPLHTFKLKLNFHSNHVNLEWIAENEYNTDHFEIERSVDGIHFSMIASKPVTGPANTHTTYQHADNVTGINGPVLYYRIKAEDRGLKFAYTNIVYVKLTRESGILAWPTPFTDKLNISYIAPGKSLIKLSLVDYAGKLVRQNLYTVSNGLNQLSLNDLSGLNSGVYFIRIIDTNTNEAYIQKLSK